MPCYLLSTEKKTEALWDTGSQVCIIDEEWKAKYAPEVTLRNISEATEAPDSLRLVAANGAKHAIQWMGGVDFQAGIPCNQ